MFWFGGSLSAKPHHGSIGSGTHPGASQPLSGDDQPTYFEIKHTDFHIDETVIMQIESMHGELLPARAGVMPNFDNRNTLLLQVEAGEAAMSTAAFATLMNRYVFNYRGTPLTNLRVSPEGDHLHLTAMLNKLIKTDMVGALSATSDGRIRFHPTTIKTADVPSKGLMDAVGLKVNKLGKGTDLRGVDVVNPFDFSLIHYYDQLIAGYTKTNANGALIAYVPDYRQLEQKSAALDLRPVPSPAATTPTPDGKPN